MYQLTELPKRSGINTTGNGTTFQGVHIEEKIRRLTETNEPIEEGFPIIYTPSNERVQPACDIRADKWDIAIDGMSAVAKDRKKQYEAKQKAKEELTGQNKPETNTKEESPKQE